MKTIQKFLLLCLLPLSFLVWGACGPYGAPAFSTTQAKGIEPDKTTFGEVKDLLKGHKYVTAESDRTFAYAEGFVTIREMYFPELGIRVSSNFLPEGKLKRADWDQVEVNSIELDKQFHGWGEGYIFIGVSSMEEVEYVFQGQLERSSNKLWHKETGSHFEFKADEKGTLRLDKVVIV